MAKRPYNEYPSRLMSILERFEYDQSPMEFDMLYREAISTRHQFYRFVGAVHRAMTDGDEFARKLNKIAKDLSIRVVPNRAPQETPSKMIIYMSPLAEKQLSENKELKPTFTREQLEEILNTNPEDEQ